MSRRRLIPTQSAAQRGLSLVELMVGVAIGLFVVAGASIVVSTQLGDNRRLLLETQIQQDLRATADIITRELRRAGVESNPITGVWAPGQTAQPSARATITHSADFSEVGFEYVRQANPGPWGFKQDGDVIRTRVADGGWQELTDRSTMRVTAFRVTPLTPVVEALPCARACSADPLDTACWPTLTMRAYQIEIEAEAVSDTRVKRSIRSQVRLRNDAVAYSATLPPNQACP